MKIQNIGSAKINNWIKEVMKKQVNEFYTVANSVKNNLENILNIFINQNMNSYAESFNSKINLVRANQRGVVDVSFFI